MSKNHYFASIAYPLYLVYYCAIATGMFEDVFTIVVYTLYSLFLARLLPFEDKRSDFCPAGDSRLVH